jgi:hypothetical protein
MPPQDTS